MHNYHRVGVVIFFVASIIAPVLCTSWNFSEMHKSSEWWPFQGNAWVTTLVFPSCQQRQIERAALFLFITQNAQHRVMPSILYGLLRKINLNTRYALKCTIHSLANFGTNAGPPLPCRIGHPWTFSPSFSWHAEMTWRMKSVHISIGLKSCLYVSWKVRKNLVNWKAIVSSTYES